LSGTVNGASMTDTSGEIEDFAQRVNVGDILRVIVDDGGEDKSWYGIINNIDFSGPNSINMETWKSSRFTSSVDPDTIPNVKRVMAFDGMFNGINDIEDSVNERFSVVENISAQNNSKELYNYNNS